MRVFAAALAACACACACARARSSAAPGAASSARLRTEYLDGPLSIDSPAPRFSWAPQAARRGAAVAAYRLVVTAQAGGGSTVWDSGVVASNATTNVPYAGAALASDADYSWSVVWTDELGADSAPASAAFSTALFAPSDWRGAHWVGGNFIRAEFNVTGGGARVKRARLFISVPGFYKAYINGALTDDHELGGFTTFEERVMYDAVDVTALVVPGCNALGVLVAGGWWAVVAGIVNRPHDHSTRVVLSVTTLDGATTYYASTLDGGGGLAPGTLPLSFSTSTSPLTSDNVYGGQSYDARLEQPGWASCAFTPSAGAAAWSPAGPVSLDPLAPNNLTGGPFISANSVQITVDEEFPLVAVSAYPTGDGSFLADFGQNLAGFPTIHVVCADGPQTISLRLAESLRADGTLQDHYGGTISFTCAGTGELETHVSLGQYSGYRYAHVTGFPGTLAVGPSLVSHFVHADLAPTGAFASSSALLNKVQHATRFAALSNLMQTPTDCPTREKHGYLGDGGLAAETEVLNFDMAAYYSRWMRDVRDDQRLRAAQGGGNIPPGGSCPGCVPGCVPDVVPFYTWGACPGDPGWTFGYPHIVDLVHTYHADDLIVQQHFDGVAAMTGVYEAMLNNASTPNPGALSYVLYGDWNTIEQGDDRTHGADLGTFHFTRDADILARWAADVTHNESAQAKYEAMAAAARAAYRANFFDAKHVGFTDPAYYGSRFPAISQIIALALGGVTASDAEAAAVFANFMAGLAAGDDVGIANASVWGIVGQKHAYPVLQAFGREDFALDLLLSTQMPSPGYWIEAYNDAGDHIGATTLWEWWVTNATLDDGWSHNHIVRAQDAPRLCRAGSGGGGGGRRVCFARACARGHARSRSRARSLCLPAPDPRRKPPRPHRCTAASALFSSRA